MGGATGNLGAVYLQTNSQSAGNCQVNNYVTTTPGILYQYDNNESLRFHFSANTGWRVQRCTVNSIGGGRIDITNEIEWIQGRDHVSGTFLYGIPVSNPPITRINIELDWEVYTKRVAVTVDGNAFGIAEIGDGGTQVKANNEYIVGEHIVVWLIPTDVNIGMLKSCIVNGIEKVLDALNTNDPDGKLEIDYGITGYEDITVSVVFVAAQKALVMAHDIEECFFSRRNPFDNIAPKTPLTAEDEISKRAQLSEDPNKYLYISYCYNYMQGDSLYFVFQFNTSQGVVSSKIKSCVVNGVDKTNDIYPLTDTSEPPQLGFPKPEAVGFRLDYGIAGEENIRIDVYSAKLEDKEVAVVIHGEDEVGAFGSVKLIVNSVEKNNYKYTTGDNLTFKFTPRDGCKITSCVVNGRFLNGANKEFNLSDINEFGSVNYGITSDNPASTESISVEVTFTKKPKWGISQASVGLAFSAGNVSSGYINWGVGSDINVASWHYYSAESSHPGWEALGLDNGGTINIPGAGSHYEQDGSIHYTLAGSNYANWAISIYIEYQATGFTQDELLRILETKPQTGFVCFVDGRALSYGALIPNTFLKATDGQHVSATITYRSKDQPENTTIYSHGYGTPDIPSSATPFPLSEGTHVFSMKVFPTEPVRVAWSENNKLLTKNGHIVARGISSPYWSP